jgi:hypothetical protein
VGENLAVARALRSIANRLERQAQGYLRHAESNKAHKEEIAEKKAAGAPTGEHIPRWSSVDGTGGRGDVGWNARKGFPPISDLPQEGGPIKGYDQGFDRL